jgi:hypothetical protein
MNKWMGESTDKRKRKVEGREGRKEATKYIILINKYFVVY